VKEITKARGNTPRKVWEVRVRFLTGEYRTSFLPVQRSSALQLAKRRGDLKNPVRTYHGKEKRRERSTLKSEKEKEIEKEKV